MREVLTGQCDLGVLDFNPFYLGAAILAHTQPFVTGGINVDICNLKDASGNINGIVAAINKAAVANLTGNKVSIKSIRERALENRSIHRKIRANNVQAVFAAVVRELAVDKLNR